MIEYVYKLDVRDPSVILKEGFSGGATSHLDPRIYGSQTIQACRSVLGLISFGLERINGRSGERVERPQYLPPRLRPIGNGVLYAYRIDIRGTEHIEVTPELGFSYPTTLNHAGHFSNGEDIRQLNYCSPLIPSFRGQREPFRDMGREAGVSEGGPPRAAAREVYRGSGGARADCAAPHPAVSGAARRTGRPTCRQPLVHCQPLRR
jgi:hypothetical protein